MACSPFTLFIGNGYCFRRGLPSGIIHSASGALVQHRERLEPKWNWEDRLSCLLRLICTPSSWMKPTPLTAAHCEARLWAIVWLIRSWFAQSGLKVAAFSSCSILWYIDLLRYCYQMGGQSSKILDHVKMANKDSEVMHTKLLKLIERQGSDVNYSGKVYTVIVRWEIEKCSGAKQFIVLMMLFLFKVIRIFTFLLISNQY